MGVTKCACGAQATTKSGQCRTCYKRDWRRARSAAWQARERKVETSRTDALALPGSAKWPAERVQKGGKRTAEPRTPASSASFDGTGITPAYGSGSSLSPTLSTTTADLEPGVWEAVRDGWTPPRNVSAFDGAEHLRGEFLQGCRALGLRIAYPQQLIVADACNATRHGTMPLFDTIGIVIPRRASKSTSLIALLVGRCLERPGYLVGITFATTGTKLAQRFKNEYFRLIERTIHDRVKIGESNGHECIRFNNGSRIDLLPPRESAFRSEAYDCVLVDEAGEASPLMTDELLQAILPTMDTRPDSQLIIAGTAPEFRDGNLLWDRLVEGRDGRAGIVEYSAGTDLTVEDYETWELVEPLVLAAHPGIGSLTTIDKVRPHYGRMGPVRFAQEYLSIAGDRGATAGALSVSKWASAELTTDLPDLPERVAFAFGVHTTACVAAAWRDRDGLAHVILVDHRDGTAQWIADTINSLAGKRPRAPFAHDDRGPVMVAVEELRRSSRARLAQRNTAAVTTAAALLQRELHTGRLHHYGQAQLTAAAITAAKRDIGRAWAFGRPSPESDILALEVASLALHAFDDLPQRRELPRMTAA